MKSKLIWMMLVVVLLGAGTIAVARMGVDGKLGTAPQKNPAAPKVDPAEQEIATDDDPWKEITQLVDHYYDAGGISYAGTMRLLDESGDQEKLMEQMAFQYSLMGEAFSYQLGQMECVAQPNLLLMADHESKAITVSNKNQAASQKMMFDLNAFKKLLQEKSAKLEVTESGPEKIITVDSLQDPSVQGYRIYYNPSNYRITKMEIGMSRYNSLNEGEEREGLFNYLLEVNYEKVEALHMNPQDFHPENKFISINQGHIQLAPAYHAYTLEQAGE